MSALTSIPWKPGKYLKPNAATALIGLNTQYRAAFGRDISVTDAYRTYQEQVALYAAKPGLAAVPGTSNHGWGQALDLGDGINNFGTAQYNWMRANAPAYGWTNPPWAQPGGSRLEPWHWEHNDNSPNPDPVISEEETMKIISRIGDEAAYLVSGTSMVQITFEQAQALGKANIPIYRLTPAEVLAVMTAIHNAAVDEKVTQNAAGV